MALEEQGLRTHTSLELHMAKCQEIYDKTSSEVIDKEESFCFRLYSYIPWGIMNQHWLKNRIRNFD